MVLAPTQRWPSHPEKKSESEWNELSLETPSNSLTSSTTKCPSSDITLASARQFLHVAFAGGESGTPDSLRESHTRITKEPSSCRTL